VSGKDVNQAVQDLVLDAMQRSQEAVVDVVRSWRAQWEGSTFSLPEGLPAFTPMVTLEQVDAAFDFAERVLADQRRFTKELLRAAMPAVAAPKGGPRPVDSNPHGSPTA